MKELRRQKAVTQEQLAEMMHVSRRTVSRWETGANMPDLDLLLELADYYDVDVRQLLDGEREDGPVEDETKETVRKAAADGKHEERLKITRAMYPFFWGGALCLVVHFLLVQFRPADPSTAYSLLTGFPLGCSLMVLVTGIVITSKRWVIGGAGG